MKTGELLRQTRLEKGLTIAQVARELYIQEKYIQALEEGNYEIIPGETYQRAYFNKYADYLGLADLFARLAKSDTITDENIPDEDENILGGEWDTARWMRVGLKVASIVIIIVFAILLIKSMNTPSTRRDNVRTMESTNQTLQVVPTDQVTPCWQIPDSPGTPGPDAVNDELAHRLTLIAHGQCWVTLTTRDGVLFNNAMLPGDVLEFTEFIGFHLRAGAPEKLDVKFNGELVPWEPRETEKTLPEGAVIFDDPAPEPEPEPETQSEETEDANSGTEDNGTADTNGESSGDTN